MERARPAPDEGLERLLRRLPEEVRRDGEGQVLLGRSAAMDGVRALVRRLVPLDTSVLLTGESGTGKGLVARLLHGGSRSSGAFVSVNCAAIPDHLLESELFGHERGAFTDAGRARAGLFREAHGGVLFLDEVDALPLPMQAKLLRALDQRTVRPLGAVDEVPFDARVLAASNTDLSAAVDAGTFRQDLYFRLKVIRLHLPALREREQDVLILAQHFLGRAAAQVGRGVVGLTAAAAAKLLGHGWPGNVRELENCVVRAVATARYDLLTPADVQVEGLDRDDEAPLVPMDVMELDHVARVMATVRGSIARGAEVLGISPRTLRRKLATLGLEGHGTPDATSAYGWSSR